MKTPLVHSKIPSMHNRLRFALAQDILFSKLFRFWQSSPTNRTQSIVWLNHYGELALRAFDGQYFYSFDFVRVKASHWASQTQKGLALVV